MTEDEILLDTEERMEKAISVLKGSLSGIRTGRANPGLVDSLRVEVYGSQVPMKQLAQIIPIEARKYVPAPIAEVMLDWSVIPQDRNIAPDERGQTDVDADEMAQVNRKLDEAQAKLAKENHK